MVQSLVTHDSLIEAVEQTFARTKGLWTGCDWPTCFGNCGLDLNGMTSSQALLMACATAGVEATDWREAMQWLRLIEADAEAAEEAARWAVQHVSRGDLDSAAREAKAAVDLEARYHPRPVWAELKQILEATDSIAPDYITRFTSGPRRSGTM